MKKTLVILFALGSTSAFAARPYGEAGCGLGSVAMGKDNQVLAATTNDTFDTQTFGISSGTSNCVDDGTVKSAKAVPMFIEANKFDLAKDASRGEGEMVTDLAKLMNCAPQELGSALKANYKQVFVDSKMVPASIETAVHQIQPASCKSANQVAVR